MTLATAARATAGLMIASFVTVAAAPAARADEPSDYQPSTTVQRSSWAYVDSATPATGHPGGDSDAPVGATADGITRSYFAYDVAALSGKHILEATLSGRETHANDCGYRAVEVWVTDAFGATSSWQSPPGAQFRAATAGRPAAGCEVTDARFDVTAALVKAAAKGEAKITFELRVPAGRQADPRFGRRFASDPALTIRYNTRPVKPINLSTNSSGCGPGVYAYNTFATLSADQPDDDGYPDEKRARWAVWPTTDASKRQEALGGSISWLTATLDTSSSGITLQDGLTYGWQVRTEDGTDVSPWSKTCYFTVDATAPSPPAASSPTFPDPAVPAGGVGMPATFVLDARGDLDTVAFEWGGQYSTTTTRADHPGGTATVKYTPDSPYDQWLQVRAVDRAGHTSETTYVFFHVKESRPQVESSLYTPWGANGGIGVPGEFLFTAAEPGATRFQYQLNDDAVASVKAAADGPTAVQITPRRGGQNTLRVRSRDVAGVLSSWRVYTFDVDTAPRVTLSDNAPIVGRPVTVDVAPGMPDVEEYEYWLSSGADRRRVPADSSGRASFTWLPTVGATELHVRSRTTAGSWSPRRTPTPPSTWPPPRSPAAPKIRSRVGR